MATVKATNGSLPGHSDQEVRVVIWTPLTTTNTDGEWLTLPAGTDRSVQVFGTFDGCTVQIQGTNEAGTPSNAVALTDPSATVLDFTSAGLKQILPVSLKIRPNITVAGGGGASITVAICIVERM